MEKDKFEKEPHTGFAMRFTAILFGLSLGCIVWTALTNSFVEYVIRVIPPALFGITFAILWIKLVVN